MTIDKELKIMQDRVKELEKLNNLLANALTLKIVGKINLKNILIKWWGQSNEKADEFFKVVHKYLTNYTRKIEAMAMKFRK